MRIAIFGDVMGRSGRNVLVDRLPGLKKKYALDFIIVNAENSAGGSGVTKQICEALFDAGADVLTLGNHAFTQPHSFSLIAQDHRLLRPANYPSSNVVTGRGHYLYQTRDQKNVLVVHALGRVFMDPLDDPFQTVDDIVEGHSLGAVADAIIVDFHAEATSEKQAIANYLDGRVSAVVGSHTHVPTADARILPNGRRAADDPQAASHSARVQTPICSRRFARGQVLFCRRAPWASPNAHEAMTMRRWPMLGPL